MEEWVNHKSYSIGTFPIFQYSITPIFRFYISVLCLIQLSICSRRVLSKPTITSLQATITGTLRAPESFTISSRATRSFVTSYSVKE